MRTQVTTPDFTRLYGKTAGKAILGLFAQWTQGETYGIPVLVQPRKNMRPLVVFMGTPKEFTVEYC